MELDNKATNYKTIVQGMPMIKMTGYSDRNVGRKLYNVESLSTATELSRQSWKKDEVHKEIKKDKLVNGMKELKNMNQKTFLRTDYEVKKSIGKQLKVSEGTRRLLDDVQRTIRSAGCSSTYFSTRKNQQLITNVWKKPESLSPRKALPSVTPKNGFKVPFIHL